MWWQAKDHPVWAIAGRSLEFAMIGFAIAYVGSESLDAKDYAAVLGAIIYGRARS